MEDALVGPKLILDFSLLLWLALSDFSLLLWLGFLDVISETNGVLVNVYSFLSLSLVRSDGAVLSLERREEAVEAESDKEDLWSHTST